MSSRFLSSSTDIRSLAQEVTLSEIDAKLTNLDVTVTNPTVTVDDIDWTTTQTDFMGIDNFGATILDSNIAQLNNGTIATGSGSANAQTQRVIIVDNQDTLPANINSLDGNQINRQAGNIGTGTQRICIATDQVDIPIKKGDFAIDSNTFTNYLSWNPPSTDIDLIERTDIAGTPTLLYGDNFLKITTVATADEVILASRLPLKVIPNAIHRLTFTCQIILDGDSQIEAGCGLSINPTTIPNGNQLIVGKYSAISDTEWTRKYGNTKTQLVSHGSLTTHQTWIIEYHNYGEAFVRFYQLNSNGTYVLQATENVDIATGSNLSFANNDWHAVMFLKNTLHVAPSTFILSAMTWDINRIEHPSVGVCDKVITHKYLTLDNDGAIFNIGSRDMTLATGTNTLEKFQYVVPADEYFVAYRIIIQIIDGGSDPDKLGAISPPPTNGFSIYYKRTSSDTARYLGNTDLLGISQNADWDSVCYDTIIHLKGGGTDDVLVWRFDFSKSGSEGICRLYPTGEFTVQSGDLFDYTPLTRMTVQLQGYTVTY